MSTEFATQFGNDFANDYGKVVEKWAKKLDGVKELSTEIHEEWGADLQKALGDQVIKALLKETLKDIDGRKPTKEGLEMYAKIAAKGALATDTGDLLGRLHKSANSPITLTAAVMSPGELAKRAAQTVSQIFDMAQDRFKRGVNSFQNRFRRRPAKRRWSVHTPNSRHAALDGQVKDENEMFTYDGEEIYGPRPPGGSPANWSNCSCTIEYVR